MHLEILEINSVFYILGKLNRASIGYFISYFNNKILKGKSNIINIDNVLEIDQEGVTVLKNMIKESANSETTFYFVGNGSREIYDENNVA